MNAADNMKYIDSNVEIKQSRLDIFGAKNDKWNQKPVMDFKPTWWIVKEILKYFGNSNDYNSAREIFNELANSNELFNGMTYDLLDKHRGLTLGKASSPDEIVDYY